MPTTTRRRFNFWLAVSFLFGGTTLLLALAPELWSFVEADSDPRVRVGGIGIILHNTHGAGQLVIRHADGSLTYFNYNIVKEASAGLFLLWLFAMFARYYDRPKDC